MIKTLFQLFLAFAKIGFTSFGGTSMIPLIMEEMLSHNWLSADDVANIVAIAEMPPGSLGVNCATFAGTQTAGVLGGTAAVIGVLPPTLTLTLAAALFFQKFRESKVMLYIMRAVKPICVGMIGTNGIYFLGHHQETANTTPESYELQKTFREFLDAGCDTALMEVSSQGLMMDRVAGIHYDIGVFTNLSPDHIGPGEHKTFEEYRSWKGQLFKRCTTGVVNIDDENTEALLEGHTCKLVTYGCSEKADYRAGTYQLLRTHDFLGVQFHVSGKDDMDVKVNMPGEFSVYNALAALTVGKVLGLPDEAIHEGLGRCVVKGRVELVPISKKFTILLDYAHNEVSTESLLTTLRAYKPHRLVVVFGCGGNRSKLRRYGMGEICAKMADLSILTEDNNRFEKVEDILADIRVGMNKGNPDAKFVEIPDRLDALHYAVDHAQEGDLIAVIGKGHETYRDREGVKTPFLERELLEEYAQQIGLE